METLVMPFEEAVRFKELGGKQNTYFSWFGDPNHTLEDGTPWLFVSTTEPATMDEYDHRVNIGCQTPICAAPIIKTEIEV